MIKLLTRLNSEKKGFTIVELLIVIVVIAILAAISIVSYNGIQSRTNIVSINTSLNQINKAIHAHQALTGAYPSTAGVWRSQTDANKDTFIPSLVPDTVNSLPRASQWNGTPTFYYISTGTEYKLLYLYPSGQYMPTAASNDSRVQDMLDPNRPTRGWGYWSSGGSGY